MTKQLECSFCSLNRAANKHLKFVQGKPVNKNQQLICELCIKRLILLKQQGEKICLNK